MKPRFLTAEWRKLALANYAVDPDILRPYLPYKTEFDFWNGKCYVSLVAFRFLNTRVKGVAVPFHINFNEVNLRFYVRYNDAGVWKRGVTFIKEIVPKPALALVANTIYKEHYVTLPMKYKWDIRKEEIAVFYAWKCRGDWNTFSVKARNAPYEIKPGSEEEFISHQLWGYNRKNKHQSSEYQVEHPRWNIYDVKEYKIEVAFDKVYGDHFEFLNIQLPDSVMLAEGSEIVVRGQTKIN